MTAVAPLALSREHEHMSNVSSNELLLRVRRHPVLGVAIQTRPDGDWWMKLASNDEPPSRMTEKFVHKDGWRELTVTEQEP